MERKKTAVIVGDIVDYGQLEDLPGESRFDRLGIIRKTIVRPSVSGHGGRVVRYRDNGIVAGFSSAQSALAGAIELQEKLAERNRSLDELQRIRWRIGIHFGDLIIDGDSIYGNVINVASALGKLATPGGIILSKLVFETLGEKTAGSLISLGACALENFSRPFEAYAVDTGEKTTIRAEAPVDAVADSGSLTTDTTFEEAGGASGNILRFGDYELDIDQFELRHSGQHVGTEPKVFDLLVYLARNSDRTVTKEEIFAELWHDRIVSDSALSSQIKAARKLIGDDGVSQHTIRTVHGRGFRFILPVKKAHAPPADLEALPGPQRELMEKIASRPSLAILPFPNLSADVGEDHIADGITEDITTAISKNRWLLVIPRNTAFAFRNDGGSIRSIGQKLNADYIVTGSFRKAGTRARITIQVVDVETEHSLLAERFDRDLSNIFDLQDEITEAVTARIEAEVGLTEQRKAGKRPRKNMGAWDLYQLGCAEFYKFTPDGNLECQKLVRRALELDPEFASAYSRLAYSIVLGMVYFDVSPDQRVMDEALAVAQRAIELDDQDAIGFFTIGRVYLARCEYEQAINALEHAIELNPYLAVTYCGLGDSLAYEGRLDEAIEQFDVAIKMSPHDPFRWAFYSYRSLAHLFRSEYEDAILWARKSIQIPNAQYWARAHLVSALGHAGDAVQAKAALKQLHEKKPEFSLAFARDHLFYLKRSDQIEVYIGGLKKAGMK